VADELLLVQGFKVFLKAPFLVCPLLELRLPDVSNGSFQYGLSQRNATEVVAVTELLDAFSGRGGEGAIRSEDRPLDLEETIYSLRQRSQDFVLDGFLDPSSLVHVVQLFIHSRWSGRNDGIRGGLPIARNDFFGLPVEEARLFWLHPLLFLQLCRWFRL